MHISVRTCVAPIQTLIVPNGGSTVERRSPIRAGSWLVRSCIAPTRCSCSGRVIRRPCPANCAQVLRSAEPSTRRRPDTTRLRKIDPIHEEINNTNSVVLAAPIRRSIRKQRHLSPIRPLNVARHACLRPLPKAYNIHNFQTAAARGGHSIHSE